MLIFNTISLILVLCHLQLTVFFVLDYHSINSYFVCYHGGDNVTCAHPSSLIYPSISFHKQK